MKIWFEVVRWDVNLMSGGEETVIGTFNDVHDAVKFECEETLKRGSVYTSFHTNVCHEEESNAKI